MKDVGLDDAVEELTADEAELPVDGGGGPADEVPFFCLVMGQGRICVLEEGDGDCETTGALARTSVFAR